MRSCYSVSPLRNTSSRSIMESMRYIGPCSSRWPTKLFHSQAHLSDRDHHPQYAQSSRQQDKRATIQPGRPLTGTLARATSINHSLTSSEDDQLRTSREGSIQISEASEVEVAARPIVRRQSPRNDADAWERYAKPTLSPDGTTRKWQCTWPTTEDRKKPTCEYTSKKQLVKRHVETTHLRYK